MKSKLWVIGFSVLGLFVAANAITLGGVDVPKDKMVVYLLIGHSNMAGIQNNAPDGSTTPRTWNYQYFLDKKWVAAKETPGNTTNGLSTRGEGGPGIPFLKAMATAYPDYNFGVVSNASVSCTLRGVNTGNNNSGLPADSNRYWKGAKLYNEIVAAAKEVQSQVTLGGVICMLGTVDATRTSDTVCSAFSDDAKQMVTDLRADLNEPNLPFIIGEYEHGASGNFALTKPWPAIVDSQIKLIPSKLSRSTTVNSVGIPMLDDHHYTETLVTGGETMFASRVVAAIQAASFFPPLAGTSIAIKPLDKSKSLGILGLKSGMEVLSLSGGGLYRLDGSRLEELPTPAVHLR